MILRLKIIIMLTLSAGSMLFIASCSGSGTEDTIPITTSSERARALFIDGRDLHERFRFAESRDLFDLALKEDPQFATALSYRATVFNSPAELRKFMRQAKMSSSRVSDGEKLQILALEAAVNGEQSKRVEIYEKLVKMYPRDKRAHYLLGNAYFSQGPFDNAVKHYKKALALDRNFPAPYNQLGYAYKFMGNMSKAEKTLKRYAQLLPEDPNPYDSMGDLLKDLGRLEEANVNYQKAFALNPQFTISQVNYGLNLAFMGKYDESRAALQIAFEQEESVNLKSQYLLTQATIYAYEGDLDRAIVAIREARQFAASEGLVFRELNALGHESAIYIMEDNADEFRRLYREAGDFIAAHGDAIENQSATRKMEAEALRAKISLAVIEGDFDQARSDLDKYNAEAEKGVSGYAHDGYKNLAGFVALKSGNYAEAVERFRANGDIDIDHYLLGLAYEGLGDVSSAKKSYKQHTKRYAHSIWYALTLGRAREALAGL